MLDADIMGGYGQAMYMQIVFLNFNNKMWCQLLRNMERDGGWINTKERESFKRISKRGVQEGITHVY
jgi:hypothetical protein